MADDARTKHQKELIDAHVWRTCLNCEHYEVANTVPVCGKFHVMPPPAILVNGCTEHVFDIPF